MKTLSNLVKSSIRRLAMPIAVQPGLALTGGTVRQTVQQPEAQGAAAMALQQHYQTPYIMSAMDLSVEAEAFGCQISMSDHEVPTVIGNLVTSAEAGANLRVPKPGEKRTAVYLETVRQLRANHPELTVLAGCIGPFSLASRLVGMSEACSLTILEPDWMHKMLAKATEFLIAYVQAFKQAGADGIIMAEPGAGLLSPKALAEFSSAYIRQIVQGAMDDQCELILHNCAAKLLHLPAILTSGARILHFGAPMDLPAALAKVPAEVILCGNLDPSAVFVQASPEEVADKTSQLLEATHAFPNFVISSGCDVPPGASLANLDRFYATVAGK